MKAGKAKAVLAWLRSAAKGKPSSASASLAAVRGPVRAEMAARRSMPSLEALVPEMAKLRAGGLRGSSFEAAAREFAAAKADPIVDSASAAIIRRLREIARRHSFDSDWKGTYARVARFGETTARSNPRAVLSEVSRRLQTPAGNTVDDKLRSAFDHGWRVKGSPAFNREVEDILSFSPVKTATAARGCVGEALVSRLCKSAKDDRPTPRESAAMLTGIAASSAIPLAVAIPADRHSARSTLPSIILSDRPGVSAGQPSLVESIKVKGMPIREFLKSHGVRLYNDTAFPRGVGPMFMPNKGVAGRTLAQWGVGNAPNGAVFLGFKPGTPDSVVKGISAHELGHAVRSRKGLMVPRVYQSSKLATLLLGAIGSTRNAATRDVSGREAAAWSLATALSSLPMLHEEVQASRLGSKLVGLRGFRRLSAFRGIPSYLATAAVPAIAYGARKAVEGKAC